MKTVELRSSLEYHRIYNQLVCLPVGASIVYEGKKRKTSGIRKMQVRRADEVDSQIIPNTASWRCLTSVDDISLQNLNERAHDSQESNDTIAKERAPTWTMEIPSVTTALLSLCDSHHASYTLAPNTYLATTNEYTNNLACSMTETISTDSVIINAPCSFYNSRDCVILNEGFRPHGT